LQDRHSALVSSIVTVFLPILPAATGDSTALLISFGVHCAVAVVVVLVAGPAKLSRAARTVPAVNRPAHAQPKAT
jgi:hypothetical protein